MIDELLEEITDDGWRQTSISSGKDFELIRIMDDGEASGEMFVMLFFEGDQLCMEEQPRAKLSTIPKVPYFKAKR